MDTKEKGQLDNHIQAGAKFDRRSEENGRPWETIRVYLESELDKAIYSREERARVLLEFHHTGKFPIGYTIFQFRITFASLEDIRKSNYPLDSVHALAMKLYDLETGTLITEPGFILRAMEQWSVDRSLPRGVSFFSRGMDTTGIEAVASHAPTLRSSQLRDKVNAKYRKGQ